jgi:precorrin-2 methylase
MVAFVGSGPGDAALITVKAAKHLAFDNIMISERLCKQIAGRALTDYGIYNQPIHPATTPEGEEYLRTIANSKHNQRYVKHLLHSLKSVLQSSTLSNKFHCAQHSFGPTTFTASQTESPANSSI